MAPEAKEECANILEGRVEKRKQKGIDERDHEEELEAVFPEPKSRALHRQFAFGEAVGHLDLPAASISQHEAPSVIGSGDRFIGEQIPRGATFAWAGNEEPKSGWIFRMRDLAVVDACLALTVATTIPDQAIPH
jgi:hypothetical protein